MGGFAEIPELESNIGKHGVGFAEAALVLEDPAAIVVDDESDQAKAE